MLQSQAPIIMKISTFFVCLILFTNANPNDNLVKSSPSKFLEIGEWLNITGTQDFRLIWIGSTPELICNIKDGGGEVFWTRNGTNILFTDDSKFSKKLTIQSASLDNSGTYTCVGNTSEGMNTSLNVDIRVIVPGHITGGLQARVNLTSNPPATLSCDMQGYPLDDIKWRKIGDSENNTFESLTQTVRHNETHLTTFLNFTEVTMKNNGTYECMARDYERNLTFQRSLFVHEVPQIQIDFTKAIGANSVYINWTVVDRNEPVIEYFIQQMENGAESWDFSPKKTGGNSTSHVVEKLKNSTQYKFKITAHTSIGDSHPVESGWVTTLEKDPEFIPVVTLLGNTMSSITVKWEPPHADLRDHVHSYKTRRNHSELTEQSIQYPANPRDGYTFQDLQPGTSYTLQVAACNEYTNKCGNWSVALRGETQDGAASPPTNVTVICQLDSNKNLGDVTVTWSPPNKPNGFIVHYNVVLNGVAEYKNDVGKSATETLTPIVRNVDRNKTRTYTFSNVAVNTRYTVSVSGVTRVRTAPGDDAKGECTMPTSIPSKENFNLKSWSKLDDVDSAPLFKLRVPRISERNGPICCYRIFIVKLAQNQNIRNLPDPKDSSVHNYQQVYESKSGAYLADMFDSDQFLPEIFIGDGKTFNTSNECLKCVGLRPKSSTPVPINLVPEPPTTVASTNANVTNITPIAENNLRRKREDVEDSVINVGDNDPEHYLPVDGRLDDGSNYTGFIEVMVYGGNSPVQYYPAYSGYLEQCFAGFASEADDEAQSSTLGIMMQICIALLIIVLVILMGMCVLHKYLKHAREGGEEIISLRNSFRHLCRTLRGRHQLVASSPPDMPPLSRSDLLQAYIDRHKDSDYGFQHEFELLPDRFADRTTRASESRENLYKNRYPDIKCYDQTRVRLVQIDGISGSDYINANFVLGYKERKKFICAQGPMENTVCDYWRMIWEQHLELVLMLTNLEEYSKTKCAKYWPDKNESKNFGDITVEHVRERPYSDYVVRELKMTRTGERDSRIIIQHHFLVWKDFMAPEHPHAILRFIKRVNEAYSLEKGPILVHCSAGVGRTGTLVALDSLLQQLNEEGQVSIFNTVCDLRHQRNFLVQSLKQYIFVYRALMEMAQYGDTEISANQLKTIVDKHRQRDNGKDKSKMEEEFEKIHSVLEDRKSFSVGGGDENRIKNRNELVIPYDRNRVILTPVPGREHSTYINASFIEGYDNSESFIITQDPLETTVPDFWRMISEQCASTIVMLSDLSEGPRKCPRYWPDDEIAYDHIRVRYIQSESCPYYTRRELSVVNSKTDENMVVTQYHYHGWPTVEGEVPEVTRGLIELVDQTIANDVESGGPLVVHCNCGSDRSSMFVALSILVQQLRTERRVDIFTTTKKLRSQRHGMIGTFSQYEFLHRAIVNYSDLHNLAEEDSSDS